MPWNGTRPMDGRTEGRAASGQNVTRATDLINFQMQTDRIGHSLVGDKEELTKFKYDWFFGRTIHLIIDHIVMQVVW